MTPRQWERCDGCGRDHVGVHSCRTPATPPVRLTQRGRDLYETGLLLAALVFALLLVSAVQNWI